MLKRNNFKSAAGAVVDWIDSYFQRIESLPVKSSVQPGDIYKSLSATPPVQGEPIDRIIDDIETLILPGITHWQHPNFHAYFPGNSSVESVLAESITSAIGAQCMIWETSPAAAELEQRVLEWFRDLMSLPNDWEGVIQDTASTATLTAIICAREKATNFESNEHGVPNNLRVYCSTQTHSSIEKAVGISGIGRRNLVQIPVDDQMRMIPDALDRAISDDKANGYLPCCVIATIGTTSTVAVDPISPISKICQTHDIWLHIDAAYAGSALILPEYQWMAKGCERADSFVFNPHKWLFTNFDCTAYYVKDANHLIRTFEILPEYLKTQTRGLVNDYRDWGIPLGRRFRALKLWVVMRSYGVSGMQETLRKQIKLNSYFADKLKKSGKFELIFNPFLNYSCFRYHPAETQNEVELNTLNRNLLILLNASGAVYLSHTIVDSMYAIRVHFGQTYIEKKHVDILLNTITGCVEKLDSNIN